MRLRLDLLSLYLCLAACGGEKPNLIAGDAPADSDAVGSVADDSGPVEVGPTTTAPWDVTLEQYPLLRLLDEPNSGPGIGSASFVLVDESDQALASGSTEFPEFMARIDAWYGVDTYITFTIKTTNVEVIDGQPVGQCGNNWAGLTQTDSDRFQRTPNELPKVKGTDLVCDASGCEKYLPIELDSLFKNEVEIEVTDTGFIVSQLDMSEAPARFKKLAPVPPRIMEGTTVPRESTTTTAAPTD